MKKLSNIVTAFLFAGLFASIAAADDVRVGAIEIRQPQARAMVPGAKVGAGYMKLTNTGSTDDRLISLTSDRAISTEIHQMSVTNGVMTMRPVAGGLEVPAGQTVELKPGGYHLMFMDVSKPFKAGETIKAVMTFEKAGKVEVEFAVGGAGANSPSTDHHTDMSKPQ
ncbi:copper chaperone PCu(A)C [Rhizobium cauense]|uniref:copper chaperone PCu(A)C n=1 Tax=Rhizobium cauense TaxID=1166683 RepID=UPI001C6EE2DF|nr:copper chaperone PCu(A)C [Rhizobium cauense]MBW9113725.1 copper chaperone PCu(A)C [Rhizobium cauense]